MSTPTSTVTFRPCSQDDLARLRELVQELYDTDTGHYEDSSPNIDLTFQELTSHPEKGLLVLMEHNKQTIGYALLIFFWSNEFRGNVIDIDEILVSKEHRGLGAGSAFFGWLEAEFGSKCKGFSLQVSYENPKAQKLYERFGFNPSMNRHMLRRL